MSPRPGEAEGLRRLLGLALRGGALSAGGNALMLGLGVLNLSLLGHGLGLRLFGLLAAARILARILNNLVGCRCFEVTQAFLLRLRQAGEEDAARGLLLFGWAVEGASVLGTAGLAALAAAVWPSLLPASGLLPVAVLIAAAEACNNLSVQSQAVLRIERRYGRAVLQQLLGPLGRTLAYATALLLLDGGLLEVALAEAVAMAAAALAGPLVLVPGGRTVRLGDLRALLRRHGPALRATLAATWSSGCLKASRAYAPGALLLLLGPGAEALALFEVATRLAGYLGATGQPLIQVQTPEIHRLVAAGRDRLLRRYLLATSAGIALAMGGAWALFALLEGPVLRLLAGEDFLAASPAIHLCMAGVLCTHVFFWMRGLLLARGLNRPLFLAELTTALAGVLTGLLAIPAAGATGAALASAVLGPAFLLTAGLALAGARRRTALRPDPAPAGGGS